MIVERNPLSEINDKCLMLNIMSFNSILYPQKGWFGNPGAGEHRGVRM